MTQFTPPQGIFYSPQAFQLLLFQAVAGPLQVLQDWDRNLSVHMNTVVLLCIEVRVIIGYIFSLTVTEGGVKS